MYKFEGVNICFIFKFKNMDINGLYIFDLKKKKMMNNLMYK